MKQIKLKSLNSTKTFTVQVDDRKVWLNGQRAKYIGRSSRKIYKCGKYVIKIDDPFNFVCGRQAYTEYTTYKKIKKWDKRFFAQIYAYGDGIIVQKYIDGKHSTALKYLYIVQKIAKKCGIKRDVGISVAHNYKIYNGRPIIYDMGIK